MKDAREKLRFGQYDCAAFWGFSAYAGVAMVLPVLLSVISRDLGFPLEDGNQGLGGALHLFRSISMMVMMLSAPFIASRFGKRPAIAAALLVMGTGFALTAAGCSYLTLAAAVILSALGQGVFEVMVTPVAQDLHRNGDAPRYLNITHSFWPVGVVCIVLVAGWLLGCGVPWRLIVLCCGILAVIPGILFLLPSRTQSILPADHCPPAQTLGKMRDILRVPRFWLFLAAMFLIGGAEHCLNFWMPTYVRGHFDGSGVLVSLGPAVFAAGMAAGRIAAGIFCRGRGLRRMMITGVVAALLAAVACQFAPTIWIFYGLVALMGFAGGPVWPSLHSLCAESIPGDRTVMFILLPCVGIPGCGFFPWLMGLTADYAGLQRSFLMLPACFLTLLVILILLQDSNRRESHCTR